MNAVTRPDGIEPRHIHAVHGSGWRTWAGLAGLVPLLLLALLGVFGVRQTVVAAGSGVSLTVAGPERIRSGEYLEMLFTIEAEREIKDAVLSVDAGIWHDITINTMIPQPAQESFDEGSFEFSFGALPPGSRLLVKVDGQVNPAYPPGRNAGTIEVTDGGATLASVDYAMTVFP